MILESAKIDVRSGQATEFEAAFGKIQNIITGMEAFISHPLKKCIEKTGRYPLLLKWPSLLHLFYNPLPEVEQYKGVYGNAME